jgi:hypothetical protein
VVVGILLVRGSMTRMSGWLLRWTPVFLGSRL